MIWKYKNNNMKTEESIKIEGYWYSEHYPKYPMPVSNVLSEKEANIIYNLIIKKEKIAQKVLYRGFSYSRITEEILGCCEYQLDNYSWPGDFASHYVLTHKVKPTDDFLKFIGYKE